MDKTEFLPAATDEEIKAAIRCALGSKGAAIRRALGAKGIANEVLKQTARAFTHGLDVWTNGEQFILSRGLSGAVREKHFQTIGEVEAWLDAREDC